MKKSDQVLEETERNWEKLNRRELLISLEQMKNSELSDYVFEEDIVPSTVWSK